MSSSDHAATPAEPGPQDTSADVSCDVLVIGGGINGTGIARDLAGRGWSVVLCEQHDLARHTSSASTKLIHGGLRYLEHGQIGLVRKALQEREGLLRGAPHIMAPLRFVLPHDAAMRPAWMIRAGLWLYDHLARRDFLPGSGQIALEGHVLGRPLQSGWRQAFVYSDGWVDDARLVVLCAQDARDRGATILTHTRCHQLRPLAQGWEALLAHHDPHSARLTHHVAVRARLVVNAAGPWADQVQAMMAADAPGARPPARHLRLVKGSHIVLPRLFEHDHAYIFQGHDRRIVFAIPYEQRFTLIGTTDVDHVGGPGTAAIDEAEVAYLCDAVNRYFRQPVRPLDVVWSYAGVRPLMDGERSGKASAVTRDYRLQRHAGAAPWLTVWGGKITTFRKLSEQAGDVAGELLHDRRPAWTREAVLPGGRLLDLIEAEVDPVTDMAEFQRCLRQRHPWMDLGLVRRWSRQYGAQVLHLLEGVQQRADLGAEIAPGVHEAELFYLRRQEWAFTGDDVLWRRTKLGLHLSADQREAVSRWMAAQGGR